MTYVLSEEGRLALQALAEKPILYAFDFDGTLAPISPNRDAVKIPPSITKWIKELAKRVPCAIVSGRALADLVSRINGTVPYLIGNHGIESSLTPLPTLLWAEEICAGWKRNIATRLAEAMNSLGGEVEDKRYSLTVHYQACEQEAGIRLAILRLLQQLDPTPDLIAGKSSVNVIPPGQGGKGQAVLALMRHLRQIGLFFVGDDETDENVFGLQEGLAMGIRVGIQAESHAKFYLKHQGEMEEVLRFLVNRIDRTLGAVDHDSRQTNDTREAANDS